MDTVRQDDRAHEERRPRRWVAVAELVVVTAIIVADLLLPTLVILAVAALTLAVRRQGLRSIGLVRGAMDRRALAAIAGIVVAWTALQLALSMPLLEHLSGTRQDVSTFAEVEGNVGLLLVLLALSWTLAAFGEELAYRGYAFTRARDAGGPGRVGTVLAVLVPAVLFAIAHVEQGVVGVGLTFLDALLFGALRVRYGTVLAPVVAHGLNNTIGLTAYYVVGPIYAPW